MASQTIESSSRSNGFTLVEVALSLGIVTVAILSVVGLFGTALNSSRDALDFDEVTSHLHAAEQWLETAPFDTVFTMVQANGPAPAPGSTGSTVPSPDSSRGLYAYSYRGDPSGALRADGSLPPYTGSGVRAGRDYEIVTVARDTSDTADRALMQTDLPTSEGRIIKVVPQLSDANPIADLTPLISTNYLQAIIAMRARVYLVDGLWDVSSQQDANPASMTLKAEPNFARLR